MTNKKTISKISKEADVIAACLRELARQIEQLTNTLDDLNYASNRLWLELEDIEDE